MNRVNSRAIKSLSVIVNYPFVSGGRLLVLTNRVATIDEGRETIRNTFKDGSALQKFHDMMIAQGVSVEIAKQLVGSDESVVQSILKLDDTAHKAIALQTGFVQSIDALKLGTIIQRLGQFVSDRRAKVTSFLAVF